MQNNPQNNTSVKILTQFIKDFSFETPGAPEIFFENLKKPDISISFNLDAVKLSENESGSSFNIILKLDIDSTHEGKKIFICQLEYCGIFLIENLENKQLLEQILLVYCPNLLFPYIRRIISNVTSDAGFNALMLDPIDFATLYTKRKIAQTAEPVSDTKN